MPDDLVLQIPALHELVRANGWPLLMIDGVEADGDDRHAAAAQAKARQCNAHLEGRQGLGAARRPFGVTLLPTR